MTDKIRARLDEIRNDVTGAWDGDVFDALRAVLDLCDDFDANGNASALGDPCAATWHKAARLNRRAIADALGVEKLDPIIVAINADKMNPYRHG